MSRRTGYGPGTTVLVTGGAGGIGSALGAELARRGATVVLADLDGAALDVRDGDAFAAFVDRRALSPRLTARNAKVERKRVAAP